MKKTGSNGEFRWYLHSLKWQCGIKQVIIMGGKRGKGGGIGKEYEYIEEAILHTQPRGAERGESSTTSVAKNHSAGATCKTQEFVSNQRAEGCIGSRNS